MTVLACNIERTGSILRAHDVVCVCVCVCVCVGGSNFLHQHYIIMAYGSMPYVGMAPEKNGGHIKSENDTLEMSALD